MKQYKVVIEPEAGHDLENIFDFISLNDTSVKAECFLGKLKESIDSLSFMPMRCRNSLYVDDDRTRDMIISGYTICYQIRDDSTYCCRI